MKKKVIWLSFIILFGFTSGICLAKYSGGDGTPGNPYRISDANDMNNIGLHDEDWGSHFVMVNDVNLAEFTGTEFNLIGNDSNAFTGVFDGNNYSILNFDYSSTMQYVGLFGTVESAGLAISDLTLVNPYIRFGGNSRYAGILIGHLKQGSVSNCNITNADMITVQFSGLLIGLNEGDVSDCDVSGDITFYGYSGGLVGQNFGSITACTASVITNTTSDTYFCAGGLVGRNETGGEISSCSSSGQVTGAVLVGGLVGSNKAVITDCTFDGTVIGKDSAVGGLIGGNSGTVTGSQANCDVICTAFGVDFIGGLIGGNAGTVTNCSTYGTVSVSGWDSKHIGGFIGNNHDSTVMDCQSNSEVIGAGPNIGGFIGTNSDSQVIRCVARGNVTSSYTNGSVGGFIGYSRDHDTIKYCYSTGNVSGGKKVGGLIGSTSGFFIGLVACYATGDLTGSEMVGGLIGHNDSTYPKNCYSTCSVPQTGSDIGGLIGKGRRWAPNTSYWNIETSGTTISDGGVGLTSEQMRTKSIFVDAGWDFTTPIWTIDEGLDYPRLWWETIEPVELLDILAQGIIDLDLQPGIENSLLAKLDTALQKLEDDNENNDAAAVKLLEAFINTVEAQRGKKIPKANADALIAAAQEIIDLLSNR